MQIASYNSHLGLLSIRALSVGHHTAYSARREAHFVMPSPIWARRVLLNRRLPVYRRGEVVLEISGNPVHQELAPVAIREGPALPCDCDAAFQPFASGLLSATSPANDDSTPQPKAVLMVVLAADREATAVAKPGVEIFGLYEA